MEYKISDITKAIRKAGYKAVTIDEATKGRQPLTFYKYKGGLHIDAGRVGFSIEGAKAARIFRKYHTSVIDGDGGAHEVATDCPEFFFPRFFGYLNGDLSELQIIADVCS